MASWKDNVRLVDPYTPGEQPQEQNIVKLNTNENPYPPSPVVQEAIKNLEGDGLRLYPDPKASRLVNAIAEKYGVSPENVFAGVGSDDVIAMCFMTFFNSKDKPVLFPNISYSFYEVWAEMLRIPYEEQPLLGDFTIKKEYYLKPNGGIIFPNPNAPTGMSMELSDIEYIVANNPESVVMVDEAYVDFGAKTALPLIDKYDNVLVIRTFSKSRSLAGLRIGYAFGDRELIKYLNDVKYSFNSYTLNRPAIELGTAVLCDDKYFNECIEKIKATREYSRAELTKLGFKCLPSDANFLFITHPSLKAKDIYENLRKKGIFVRWFDKMLIDNYLRVTIGRKEEMDRLFDCLKDMGVN